MSNEFLISDNNLIDSQFKDASPTKTVEKIKQILNDNNIKTTENFNESGLDYCHSLRVWVDGTKFGTNGKGLTKEFAIASAYGELIERMQLGLFGDSSIQKLGYFNFAIGEEETSSIDDLYNEFPSWYDFLADKISELDKEKITGKDLLSKFATDNKVETVKFFNISTGKKVLLAKNLRCIVCGSNGGAAGNTMEEAVVQAISEIVERHYKLKILQERISLPNIPEDVLKNFSTAYKIIENIRNKGYNIIVKDCSLEKKFPVVCVCYINKKTGKYHTHFGAHPILEIALERTLTESFQGRNIDNFASNESFIYSEKEVFSYKNVYKDLKKGDYLKTPEFFVGDISYKYNANVGFEGKTNVELLPQVIDFFKEQGYEILVRDSSSLGFPTFNVFIPKYCEVLYQSLSKKYFSSFAYSNIGIKSLKNLQNTNFDDLLFTLMHINEVKKLSILNPKIFNFSNCSNIMLKLPTDKDSYLMHTSLAYIYYEMNNLTQVSSFIKEMLPLADEKNYEYILCLNRYLDMKLKGYDDNSIKKLISFFHNEITVIDILECIENGKNPFSKLVLHCDENNCDLCDYKDFCCQKNTLRLVSIVRKKASNLNFDKFVENLKKYTKN